jgi:hypothetical protein
VNYSGILKPGEPLAANLAGASDIRASILPGTRQGARRDRHAADAAQGRHRTAVETEGVIAPGRQCPDADKLTDILNRRRVGLAVRVATARRMVSMRDSPAMRAAGLSFAQTDEAR